MHNKIKSVALAVALAVTGTTACAQSSITLQGLVDVNLQNVKRSGTGYAATERTTQTVQDGNGMTTSWWGLTGTEPLGGKLRASFALQGFFRPDTGEPGRFGGGGVDALFKRAAWVALEHADLGRMQFGRQGTQYFGATLQTNPFGDSFGFSPAVLNTFGTALGAGLGIRYARDRFVLGDSGWSNAVQYTSPSVMGLTGSLMWSQAAWTTAAGTNASEDGTEAGRAYSGALTYRSGALLLTGVYQDLRPNAVDQKQTAWMLGSAYDFKVVRVFGQYHSLDTRQTTGRDADTGWQVGASVPLGKGALLASYFSMKTQSKTGAPVADESRDTYAVGYRYDISRRTDLYAVYLNDDLDAPTPKKRTSIGLGMRHRF